MDVSHSAEHAVVVGGNLFHARNASYVVANFVYAFDLLVRKDFLFLIWLWRCRRLRQVKCEYVFGASRGILTDQMRERLHHEGRARQQHKGQRHLEHDQSVTELGKGTDAARPSLFQNFEWLYSPCPARRHRTENQAREERARERKPYQRPVRGDFVQSRSACRCHRAKGINAQNCNANSRRAAQQTEQATFHQALPSQSSRSSSKCRAHGHFAVPSTTTSEEQAG